MKKNFQRIALAFLTIPLLVVAGYCSFKIYDLSETKAEIKTDYSVVNNITYGLLSVDTWKNHLVQIVSHRIDDFEFTKQQEQILKDQLEQLLHAVIDKADTLMHQKQKTVKGKIRKMVINALVNEDKMHAKVPVFAETILGEIKKKENKTKIKDLILEKIEEYGALTYDSANDVSRIKKILAKYELDDLSAFNIFLKSRSDQISEQMYRLAFAEILIVVIFLILWLVCFKHSHLHNDLYTASILLALILLVAGLTAPMIEIDARIKEMSFLLMGEHLAFHDQIIFFQTKSIVDVVDVLMETGKWDSMIVGVLILVFSIVFPIAKLISAKLYQNPRWSKNHLLHFFALKSGKWSMADVYVVAIFMAYIGFKGILDDQLSQLNFKTNSLASISTNETTLQPGFLLFVCFVLFGLILSAILEKLRNVKYPNK